MSPEVVLSRSRFDAVLFDMDGVITRTAGVHATAWQRMFDAFLEERAARTGEPFVPFDPDAEYRRYVDGKPRFDGVASFLASRGISLPRGDPDDPPGAETVCGLGNRKNVFFREHLAQNGAEVYQHAVDLVRRLRAAAIKTAVFSASKNCEAVLRAAGVLDLFDARVDGVDAERLGLAGKPAPDMLLEAARRLGATPGRTAVFEDAVAGVQAGRAGGFALVAGVNHTGHPGTLLEHGAGVEVDDLGLVIVTDGA